MAYPASCAFASATAWNTPAFWNALFASLAFTWCVYMCSSPIPAPSRAACETILMANSCSTMAAMPCSAPAVATASAPAAPTPMVTTPMVPLTATPENTSLLRVLWVVPSLLRCFSMMSRFLRALWIAGAAKPTPMAEIPAVRGRARPETAVEVDAPEMSRV